MRIDDYLIAQEGIDWSSVLAAWSWRLPPRFTLWMVNRFAELVIVFEDGSVQMLHTDTAMLARLADSREHFCQVVDENDNGNDWLMIPLVDDLVAAGLTLGPGQCYCFKVPPALGGAYGVGNVAVISLCEHLSFLASFYEQLEGIPDGNHVVLRTSDA